MIEQITDFVNNTNWTEIFGWIGYALAALFLIGYIVYGILGGLRDETSLSIFAYLFFGLIFCVVFLPLIIATVLLFAIFIGIPVGFIHLLRNITKGQPNES